MLQRAYNIESDKKQPQRLPLLSGDQNQVEERACYLGGVTTSDTDYLMGGIPYGLAVIVSSRPKTGQSARTATCITPCIRIHVWRPAIGRQLPTKNIVHLNAPGSRAGKNEEALTSMIRIN